MYYTPRRIIEPAAGSGEFLSNSLESVIGNPPFSIMPKTHFLRFLSDALRALVLALLVQVQRGRKANER